MGHLAVNVTVINDGSPLSSLPPLTNNPSSFTVHVFLGLNHTAFTSFPGADELVSVDLPPGHYRVTQDLVPNYRTGFSPDCFGSIGTGETKQCTIINDDSVNIDGGAGSQADECSGLLDFIATSALIATLGLPGTLISFFVDVTDPGWVWVQPGASTDATKRYRTVTGMVTDSGVSYTDFPTLHDSHDLDVRVKVDPGYEDVLSSANDGEASMEWETGILPDQLSGDGNIFPKWAWPSVGDRVWTEGHWIFDCGHPSNNVWHTEIHPARAIASMRNQMRALPGTGTTPVRVTATDLYIHGESGFAVQDIKCGFEMTLSLDPSCDETSTPIDTDYTFSICTPPLPFDKALLATSVENGPGNTVGSGFDPVLQVVDSTGACSGPGFGPSQVNVTVPLAGSGVSPSDVYARRIYAGWVFPSKDLRHFKLTLNQMTLHQDFETQGWDCECTFFWMNVDKAHGNEWIRLSDFATGNMNDYDDEIGPLGGDGIMGFDGAVFDYFVDNQTTVNVRANGYDQDCLDGWFKSPPYYPYTQVLGEHSLLLLATPPATGPLFACALLDPAFDGGFSPGTFVENDNMGTLTLPTPLGPPDYGLGTQTVEQTIDGGPGNFNLQYTVDEIPLTTENSVDLVLTKICKPDRPTMTRIEFVCTIIVQNPGGPGLPENVIVDDVLLTDVPATNYTLSSSFTFGGQTGLVDPCDQPEDLPGGKEFRCRIGTVPVGGKAIITVRVTSYLPGDFNNLASVQTDSNDPDLSNNSGVDSVSVVLCAGLPACSADLAAEKKFFPDVVQTGRRLTYEVKVFNAGPSAAVGVVVEDLLPSQVDLISVTVSNGAATCVALDVSGPPVTKKISCQLGNMLPNKDSPVFIYIDTLVRATRGTFSNTVKVSSSTTDPNPANNSAVTSLTISSSSTNTLSAIISFATPLSQIGIALVSIAGLLTYSIHRTRKRRSLKPPNTTEQP